MANVLVANFLFTNAGVPIEGATVDLLARNTTTPVLATTTTSATGYWAFSHATEGRYDVRITNGSSVRWHMYDASAQFTALEVQTLRVRNPAFTFDYDIVPAAITADRQLNLPLITAARTLVANNTALADSESIIFGTGADASILYDGTNLVVNPLLVGSGVLDLAAGILELNNAARFDTGVAVVSTAYSIGRDADATNQLHLNVPTGATFEWSVNDVAKMTLSATAVDFLDNSITTTGALTIASFGGNWTNAGRTVADLGIVTTVDINGGTLDGAVIGGASAAAITGTTIGGTILTMSGTAYIGDTANANATLGLTINQGAADDQILAFKSSDIATGLTTLPTQDIEADDFATFSKQAATDGGLNIQTLSKANLSMVLAPRSEDHTSELQ